MCRNHAGQVGRIRHRASGCATRLTSHLGLLFGPFRLHALPSLYVTRYAHVVICHPDPMAFACALALCPHTSSPQHTWWPLLLGGVQVKSQVLLSGALRQAGVRTAFGGDADFSRLSSARLSISEVMHTVRGGQDMEIKGGDTDR